MSIVTDPLSQNATDGGGVYGPGAHDGEPTVAAVEERFQILSIELGLLQDRDQVRLANRFEQRLAADRLLATARLAGNDGDARSTRKRARAAAGSAGGSDGRSSRTAHRDARRAAALAANPNLAGKLAEGSITGEGLDEIARAADQKTGVVPDDVIDAATNTPPDQTRRIVADHLARATSAEEANNRYATQMRARRVRRYTCPGEADQPTLAGLGIEGPDAVIDELWNLLNAEANSTYRTAGGRNRAADCHKPLDHRRFDGASRLLRQQSGVNHDATGGGRPSVVVTVDLTAPAGDGRQAAVAVGSGPISDDLLADYVRNGSLGMLITGLHGQPLWFGRSRRSSSAAQFLTLLIRDHGCVLCRASFQRCETHHLTPWQSPKQGRTDIDNLALLCGPCHRRLHQADQTLYRYRNAAGNQVWATRPATTGERVADPPRPKPIQRE